MTQTRSQHFFSVFWESGDHLRPVGQEDGWRQVAGDATEDVNDWNTQPARQFLQVPQDGHLKSHRHQAVKDPGRTETDRALTRVQCAREAERPRVSEREFFCGGQANPSTGHYLMKLNEFVQRGHSV